MEKRSILKKMDDYHKVRVYYDLPLLIKYIKEVRGHYRGHNSDNNVNRLRNFETIENSLSKHDHHCIDSISFTRKIIDIKSDTDKVSKIKIEKQKTTLPQCKSHNQNKLNYVANDFQVTNTNNSFYLVNQLNQTFIDKFNLFICNYDQNNVNKVNSNFTQTEFNDNNYFKKSFEKLKIGNIQINQKNIDSNLLIDKNLFSESIEEEYKLLPEVKNFQTSAKENESKLKSDSEKDKVKLKVDNSSYKEILENKANDLLNLLERKNEDNDDFSEEDVEDVFDNQIISNCHLETPPISLSIPNWEELCERVYKITRNDLNNTPILYEDQSKVFALRDFLPNGISSTQIINNINNISPAIYGLNDANNFMEDLRLKSNPDNNYVEIVGTLDPNLLENFDLKTFIYQQTKRIYLLRQEVIEKRKTDLNIMKLNFKDYIERLSYFSDEFPLTPYRLFLFDLCKEIILELFSMDIECDSTRSAANVYNNQLTLLLPLKMQKKLWPVSEFTFYQLVLDHVNKLLNGNLMKQKKEPNTNLECNDHCKRTNNNIKQFGLMAFCRMQRKLDFVDQILYHEMLDEQPRWSYFEPEMDEIKHLICDMIFEELIDDCIKQVF